MRYWCPKCDSEIKLGKNVTANEESCPICCDNFFDDFIDDEPQALLKLPDFETPAQYEERTGKKLSLKAPVYWKYAGGLKMWRTQSYGYALRQQKENDILIVIGNSPEIPPTDYVSEEIKKCIHCSKSLIRPLDSGHWICESCYLTQYKGKAL